MKEIPLGLSFDDVLIVPQFSEIRSRQYTSTRTILDEYEFEIPIVSANMDTVTEVVMAVKMAELGGLGVIHRNMDAEQQADMVRVVSESTNYPHHVGAAVGVNDDWKYRVELLVEAGAKFIVVDIAHGHAKHCIEAIEYLGDNYEPLTIIAGNVATPAGVRDLANAGADVIKVGIGPGSGCSTRVMTGVGYPQFGAILNCADMAKNLRVPIIADGGIRNSGDVAKALAAGASAVMIGNLLAGTTEAPGEFINIDGEYYKSYRGMASTEASGRKHAEGVSGMVKYRGSAKDVVEYLMGGLRSAMSYVGAEDLPDFWSNAEFVRMTDAGRIESAPHDIKMD
jgi:IMP dehydrogenase